MILKSFFEKVKIQSIIPESCFDELNTIISIIYNNNLNYTFKVENVINLPYFKSFTHKSINNPPFFSDFKNTFNLFWNISD